MVRNYKAKPKAYSTQALKKAIKRVTSGKMTFSQASRRYKVPRSTIANHVKQPKSKIGAGRTPVFTPEQEQLLIELLVVLSEMYVALDINEFRVLVKKFVRKLGIKTPFKNDIPGKDWVYRYYSQ